MPAPFKFPSLRAAAIATAILVCTAACSSQHANDAASDQASPTAQTAQSADTSDAGDDNNFKPCDKLAVTDVQPFFKKPVTKKPETDLIGAASGCIFTTQGNGASVQIMTVAGPSVDTYWNEAVKGDNKPGVPLAGVGDKAVREAGDIWVYAVKSGVFCMIHGDHSADQAEDRTADDMRGVSLTEARAGNIPDAHASAVAQQLGTLCNKIYGSGNTTPSFAGLN